jgi:hypothetical protein
VRLYFLLTRESIFIFLFMAQFIAASSPAGEKRLRQPRALLIKPIAARAKTMEMRFH